MARRLIAPLAATLFAAAALGCHHELPPATAEAASVPPAAAGEGSVVFVRPLSPCDESDYTIVVDEHGRFVANLAPGTMAQLSLPPGTHAFYAWSSLDRRVEKEPNFNPVSAVRVQVNAVEPEYVGLIIARAHYDCTSPNVNLLALGTERSSEEAHALRQEVKPVLADRVAGQAAIDARPALLHTYLALGEAKLRRNEEMHARESEREALRVEAQ